ncbi:hypothetical protein J7S99_13800 [Providencia rettgeri]|uniref:hypothetical protein n=1 Tax=Providencia rettgeri TaxID=587 RepID=UPI001B396351|nr:hypothetical protein [Providencia rettgeri]MBQ0398667.1 hypothetical protein [Providencia rettgeri]
MFDVVKNPTIVSALISGIVTISLFIIKGVFSSLWNKYFLAYKIKYEHSHEQKKKIKEAISKYKMPLLDSAESLNHRLWNFSSNCNQGWHKLKKDDIFSNKYYLQSFCYRFLVFYAWSLKFERELIFIDVTFADKNDLFFIKYIKFMKNIFCDATMMKNTGYNNEQATDHFFKDELISVVESMFSDSGVITYTEFKLRDKSEYIDVCNYISSISTDKVCNKWNLINCFHFTLMAFLSRFGYDYQRTDLFKLYKLQSLQTKNKLIENFNFIVSNAKLNSCKEMRKAMIIMKNKSWVVKVCDFLKIIKMQSS